MQTINVNNGYFKMPNQLMVELYNIKVTYTQLRVLLFIVRHTFGYNTISDVMSYGFISKGLSIARPNVLREVVKLEEMKIIKINKDGYVNKISINCNVDEWDVPRYNDKLSENESGVLSEDNKKLSEESTVSTDSDVLSEDNTVFSDEITDNTDSSVISADNTPLSDQSTPVLCGDNKSVICGENQINNKKTNKEKTTKKKTGAKNDVGKISFAEAVKMKPEEMNKLIAEYGKPFADRCVEELNNYKLANNKSYASDYHAIKSWVIRRVTERFPNLIKKQQPVRIYADDENPFADIE